MTSVGNVGNDGNDGEKKVRKRVKLRRPASCACGVDRYLGQAYATAEIIFHASAVHLAELGGSCCDVPVANGMRWREGGENVLQHSPRREVVGCGWISCAKGNCHWK